MHLRNYRNTDHHHCPLYYLHILLAGFDLRIVIIDVFTLLVVLVFIFGPGSGHIQIIVFNVLAPVLQLFDHPVDLVGVHLEMVVPFVLPDFDGFVQRRSQLGYRFKQFAVAWYHTVDIL